MQRVLSTVFLLGLLSATTAAFALTEHLKLIKSPIYATHVTKEFSPVCHCATDKASISFSLRHADSLTVTIVDSTGTVIDTVATDRSEPLGTVTFLWNGRTSSGTVAADGVYQPQVELSNARRTILMPNRIVVDTKTPTVLSASDSDGMLTTGGHLNIEYVLSEKAHVAVYVRGQRVVFGHAIRPQSKVKWDGNVGGHPLPPGQYVLEVGAVDVAGNATTPAQWKRVAVRILPRKTSIRVAAGARFIVHVQTRARQYRWTFAGAHGTGKKPLLHLRAPARHGRYRLVISAHGHTTAHLVIVGRR